MESLRVKNESKLRKAQMEKDILVKIADDWEGAIDDLLELSPQVDKDPRATQTKEIKQEPLGSNSLLPKPSAEHNRDYKGVYDEILKTKIPFSSDKSPYRLYDVKKEYPTSKNILHQSSETTESDGSGSLMTKDLGHHTKQNISTNQKPKQPCHAETLVDE